MEIQLPMSGPGRKRPYLSPSNLGAKIQLPSAGLAALLPDLAVEGWIWLPVTYIFFILNERHGSPLCQDGPHEYVTWKFCYIGSMNPFHNTPPSPPHANIKH